MSAAREEGMADRMSALPGFGGLRIEPKQGLFSQLI